LAQKSLTAARLHPSIITKQVSSKQRSLSAGTTPTLNLPCFTREIIRVLQEILLSVFRLLCLPFALRKYSGITKTFASKGRDVSQWNFFIVKVWKLEISILRRET
jgi:hypothetical protein